jgi:hypothetical protein
MAFGKIKLGITIQCKTCGKDAYARPSTIGRKKYCSFECMIKDKPPKPKTGSYKKCAYCKKDVWVYPRDFKFQNSFCNIECCTNFKKKRLISKDLICKECGIVYKQYPSQIKHRGSSFCSMACMKKQNTEKFIQKKKVSKNKNQSLKKQLWIYFSKYIRQRDGGVCISCGKVDDWKNTDAGHYIPKTAGLSIYFDEKNVNCQCTGCNRFRHGNLSMYAIALIKKYGDNILTELDNKRKETIKISDNEYEDLIVLYKNKIKENGFLFTSRN